MRTWWEADCPMPDREEPSPVPARAEVAVIGGGLTGLSAAAKLAAAGRDVVMLDAGPMGWGSSGRNGGMVCYPALQMSLEGLARRMGEAEARRFLAMQIEGVAHTRALAAAIGIDPEDGGTGFYEVAQSEGAAEMLAAAARERRDHWGLDCRLVQGHALPHRGAEAFAAIHYADGFAVNPLRLVLGLASRAKAQGAVLAWQTPVLSLTKAGDAWRIATPRDELVAETVIVATNAYTADRLHSGLAGRVLPAISTIVVSDPLPADLRRELQLHAPFAAIDARALLTYYRLLPDGRLLVGARGGWRGRPVDEAARRKVLARTVARKFPPLAGVALPWCWSGQVATTRNLAPSMGTLEGGRLLFALGYHGNGLNTAPWVGERLAEAALEAPDQREVLLSKRVPRLMLGRPPMLPPLPATARRLLLGAALGVYGAKDWLQARQEGRRS